jgi:transposase
MFGLGPATRIYLAAGATDMRKGFDGLYGLVRDRLLCEPQSGHLFLFCNARRSRLKVLVWDGSGLWICSKKLAKGCFSWTQSGDAQGKVVLSHEELSLLGHRCGPGRLRGITYPRQGTKGTQCAVVANHGDRNSEVARTHPTRTGPAAVSPLVWYSNESPSCDGTAETRRAECSEGLSAACST